MDPFTVLFVCTGNSARSILAEALINHLPIARGKLRGYSAGSHPKGQVHPVALEILAQQHIPVEGLRSKSWDEYSRSGAPAMDMVVTVCDQAAAEPCPHWPGQPLTAHWSLPDPAAVDATDRRGQDAAFRGAFMTLKRRIELLAALPLDALSRPALREQLARLANVGAT